MSGKPHVQGFGFALRRLVCAVCIAVLALFPLLVVTAQAQMAASPSIELCLGSSSDDGSSDHAAKMPCCPDSLAQGQRDLGGDLVLHIAPIQPGLAVAVLPAAGSAFTTDNRPGGPLASWHRGVAAARPPPVLI